MLNSMFYVFSLPLIPRGPYVPGSPLNPGFPGRPLLPGSPEPPERPGDPGNPTNPGSPFCPVKIHVSMLHVWNEWNDERVLILS